jgi:uncharacterized protein YxeA
MVAKKQWAVLTAVMVAGMLAGGCAWSRTKINDENAYVKAQAVQPGKTTAAQLEAIMGSAPNTVMPMKGNRQVFIYNFGDSKTEAFNLLIVNFSKTNARLDSAYFVIGANNVVEHKSVSNNSRRVPWEWAPFGK